MKRACNGTAPCGGRLVGGEVELESQQGSATAFEAFLNGR